jgi:hypothetical protein
VGPGLNVGKVGPADVGEMADGMVFSQKDSIKSINFTKKALKDYEYQ